MPEPLLAVDALVKRFGGLIAVDHVTLDVKPGETHALIGPNGAGKTTLISQLQGELRADAGTIRFEGRDLTHAPAFRRARAGLARSFQITSVFLRLTALANVALAAQAQAGHSFRFWTNALADTSLIEPGREALATIGLADRADTLAEALSHGERRQLELAMALAMRPKLLLLDEPMAGMGRQDGARMTRILSSLKQRYAILLVEHDMSAVAALADRVTVLVAGRTIASGTYDEVREIAEVRAAYLGERR
jgi:branched-chain amino acid transport system ATP-binding protein